MILNTAPIEAIPHDHVLSVSGCRYAFVSVGSAAKASAMMLNVSARTGSRDTIHMMMLITLNTRHAYSNALNPSFQSQYLNESVAAMNGPAKFTTAIQIVSRAPSSQ